MYCEWENGPIFSILGKFYFFIKDISDLFATFLSGNICHWQLFHYLLYHLFVIVYANFYMLMSPIPNNLYG